MEYTIRESARARKVRLIVSARDGLVVVIPRGVAGPRLTREDIDRIVAAHRDWIERTRRKVLQRQEARRAAAQAPPPSVLDLPAIGERWQIRYRATGHPGVRLTEQTRARRLEVEGAVHDSRACRAVLKGWLRQKARMHLIPWLERVSAETGLRYQQARVRCQKTRWGSCSNRGTINLNVKALFLPPELVRHLLVHELCHTVHLNHSPAFWALVRRHDPDAERLRR
ncbi:MAG TPA: SprT family zinc-dependent metalloprotease, partial [Bacillota bacterium]